MNKKGRIRTKRETQISLQDFHKTVMERGPPRTRGQMAGSVKLKKGRKRQGDNNVEGKLEKERVT